MVRDYLTDCYVLVLVWILTICSVCWCCAWCKWVVFHLSSQYVTWYVLCLGCCCEFYLFYCVDFELYNVLLMSLICSVVMFYRFACVLSLGWCCLCVWGLFVFVLRLVHVHQRQYSHTPAHHVYLEMPTICLVNHFTCGRHIGGHRLLWLYYNTVWMLLLVFISSTLESHTLFYIFKHISST